MIYDCWSEDPLTKTPIAASSPRAAARAYYAHFCANTDDDSTRTVSVLDNDGCLTEWTVCSFPQYIATERKQ